MASTSNVSIPVQLLLEAINQIVTVELKNGDRYRGELVYAEENMSLQLKSAKCTQKNGQKSTLEQIYMRGSQIKYFILPDILEESPVFKRVRSAKRKFDKVQGGKEIAITKKKKLKTFL